MVQLFLIALFVIGLSAGWAAYLVTGRNKAFEKGGRPNWGLLFVLGIAGSYTGGLIVNLLTGQGFEFQMSGLLGSILGSTLVLQIYLALKRRGSA